MHKNVEKILKLKPHGTRGTMLPEVKEALTLKSKVLSLAQKHNSPFYLIHNKALAAALTNFKKAFDANLPGHRAYYAIKTNYHPHILETAVKHGFGLDASSEREFQLALKAKAKKIIFTGPGKDNASFKLAIKHKDKTIINLDSFSELHRLAKLYKDVKQPLTVGVRFFSKHHGAWSKFGIPLKDVSKFWQEAKKYPQLRLTGLHFHSSHNNSPKKQSLIIEELANYLQKNFSKENLQSISYIDIGGGYYPTRAEGYYPWSYKYPWAVSSGHFIKFANDYFGEPTHFKEKYYITETTTVANYAAALGKVIKEKILPLVKANIFTEPGRIIATRSTHLVMRVADVKPGIVITNAGINMTGWEFGLHVYNPIINLSKPALTEEKIHVYGSLCTPIDFWGYYMYSQKNISIGDVLLIPFQGAYKFTLAQNFIKPIPSTLIL